jgi:hypothetical protein
MYFLNYLLTIFTAIVGVVLNYVLKLLVEISSANVAKVISLAAVSLTYELRNANITHKSSWRNRTI